MLINNVLFDVSLPRLDTLRHLFMKKYSEFIDKEYCIEYGVPRLFIKDPHITLIRGLEDIPESRIKKFLKVSNRDQCKKLEGYLIRSNLKLRLLPSDDSQALVIDLSEEDVQVLRDWSDIIKELPNDNRFPDYIPHITLTYVNREFTERMKDDLEDNYQRMIGKTFICINQFIISDSSFNSQTISL